MRHIRHSAWALLFVAITGAQAAPDNSRATANAAASRPTSTGSARPQSVNTANTANTAVRNSSSYNFSPPSSYNPPVERSTSTPQAVPSTSSSSSRYNFTEVAPRSLW